MLQFFLFYHDAIELIINGFSLVTAIIIYDLDDFMENNDSRNYPLSSKLDVWHGNFPDIYRHNSSFVKKYFPPIFRRDQLLFGSDLSVSENFIAFSGYPTDFPKKLKIPVNYSMFLTSDIFPITQTCYQTFLK